MRTMKQMIIITMIIIVMIMLIIHTSMYSAFTYMLKYNYDDK